MQRTRLVTFSEINPASAYQAIVRWFSCYFCALFLEVRLFVGINACCSDAACRKYCCEVVPFFTNVQLWNGRSIAPTYQDCHAYRLARQFSLSFTDTGEPIDYSVFKLSRRLHLDVHNKTDCNFNTDVLLNLKIVHSGRQARFFTVPDFRTSFFHRRNELKLTSLRACCECWIP
jgi:hypothetical protein